MTNPSAANQEIRQALKQVLAAADQIGNAPEHHGLPAHARHDETQQGLILQAWEKLALLTGNHDLARENGFEIFPAGHAQDRRTPRRGMDRTAAQPARRPPAPTPRPPPGHGSRHVPHRVRLPPVRPHPGPP